MIYLVKNIVRWSSWIFSFSAFCSFCLSMVWWWRLYEMALLEISAHTFLPSLWACHPLRSLMICCAFLFLREALLVVFPSASAIRSIIRKDGLPLPLVKSQMKPIETPDIFESCSFVIPFSSSSRRILVKNMWLYMS